MDLDFGFFYNSFVVIKYVFNSLIGTLGEHFNTVIYFAIIIGSVSTIFGLGVSIVRSTKSIDRSINSKYRPINSKTGVSTFKRSTKSKIGG